jgi:hypothetical protein
MVCQVFSFDLSNFPILLSTSTLQKNKGSLAYFGLRGSVSLKISSLSPTLTL